MENLGERESSKLEKNNKNGKKRKPKTEASERKEKSQKAKTYRKYVWAIFPISTMSKMNREYHSSFTNTKRDFLWKKITKRKRGREEKRRIGAKFE